MKWWNTASNSLKDPQVCAAIDGLGKTLELNEFGYDPWGFQLDAAKLYFSLARQIYRYFRPEVIGIENIPQGRVLVVPNHSGQLPFDALVTAVAALLEAKPPRLLRGMVERFVPAWPMVNVAFSRSGVVLGDPINCRNLLEADNGILVFPEGAKGIAKPFNQRYQLQKFGRGFMRLALQTQTPIVPVGIVGAEESIISIGHAPRLARLIKSPNVPIPALLPILGPLSMLPMPTKFHIHFGQAMHFEGPFDDEDDAIDAKVEQVKDAIDSLLDQGRKTRKNWFQ